MVDRPILFSAPMVRAILDGQKTQTRRVVKPQPLFNEPGCGFPLNNGATTVVDWKGLHTSLAGLLARCPYGQPGDRLWVRETVACGACAPSKPSEWSPSFWRREQGTPANPNGLWYAADDLAPERPITARGKWTPAIHMPRWASRILLEIVSVRVERLNDCSEADALAEGATPCANGWWFDGKPALAGSDPRGAYYCLWEHINGAGSWPANPWVWVVEFKRVQP